MGAFKIDFPHSLEHADAKARCEALLDYWSRKYGVKASWVADKATFKGSVMGITFDGWFNVGPKAVTGEATDPGFLFRGKAMDYFKRKFGFYLDPKKQLKDVQGET